MDAFICLTVEVEATDLAALEMKGPALAINVRHIVCFIEHAESGSHLTLIGDRRFWVKESPILIYRAIQGATNDLQI